MNTDVDEQMGRGPKTLHQVLCEKPEPASRMDISAGFFPFVPPGQNDTLLDIAQQG
jgi:hypothetical protein